MSAFETDRGAMDAAAGAYPVPHLAGEMADLRSALVELERRGDRLESFASVAAHELAAPLRVIAGYAALLLDGSAGPLRPEQEDFVRRMASATDRMQLLLDDLRRRARAQAQPDSRDVDLGEVVEDVREDLSVLLGQREARVEATTPMPVVRADQVQLRQLLENLVANGIKYGPRRGGVVELAAQREPEAWRISVRDRGPGIAPEDQARIFEPFRRLHTGEERIPGSGLGLAICEEIVAAHGGVLEVQSSPGEGATFSFTLPDLQPR